jgi:NAD(P)-dependent dehydrogenase (short-subunit alcohol dehydrogenase family)
VSEKRVWLITGAGRGLGVDIAKAALTAGHALVATGRDATKVAAAVGDHANLLAIKLDVTRPQDAEAAVEAGVANSAESTFWSTTRVISSPASSRNSAQNRSAIRSRRSCSVR